MFLISLNFISSMEIYNSSLHENTKYSIPLFIVSLTLLKHSKCQRYSPQYTSTNQILFLVIKSSQL